LPTADPAAEEFAMTGANEDAVATPAQLEQLQEVRPVWQLQGHEVCADIHLVLAVAQAVLTSRNERVADLPDAPSGDAVLRELRALGVREAAPQLVAMVAVVDSAVDRLAEVGTMTRDDAWEQLRKDVLVKHCQSPDLGEN
jgi:hypothetical protein